MRLMIVAAVCGLAVAMPAVAQDSGQSSGTQATPAKEKKTCRYYTSTGSIMPAKRTCHTAQEWKDIDAQNRAQTDRLNDPRQTGGILPSS